VAVLGGNFPEAKKKSKINDTKNGEKILMTTKKPTPEEITAKKNMFAF